MSFDIVAQDGYAGPNVWSQRPVGRVALHWPGMGAPQQELETLTGDLWRLLEEMPDPQSRAVPLDLQPLHPGLGVPEIVAIVAVNLQRLTGISVALATAIHDDSGDDILIFEQIHQHIGVVAARFAARIVSHLALAAEPAFDPVAYFRTAFSPMAFVHWQFIGAQPIIDAARARGIPVTRLDPRNRFYELGSGVYRRRIAGTGTSMLSAFGNEILMNKDLTKAYLQAAGLPVAPGEVVRRVEEAVVAAQRIGYPVVVKPVDAAAGAGVFLDIRDEATLRDVFPQAAASTSGGMMLIEAFVRGTNYRVTVVGGTLVSMIEEFPAGVTGDGVHTIQELIDIANADPRRGPRYFDPLGRIAVDDETLAVLSQHGLSLSSVPAAEQIIVLRRRPIVSKGGTSFDKTEETHPDNKAIVEQAVATLGLDVATIDLIATDISRSIWETSGVILEINAFSGFRIQTYPGEGASRDPSPHIVDMLFPPGQPVRAPIVAIAGFGPVGTIGEEVAAMLSAAGMSTGLANQNGVFINGAHYRGVDGRNPHGPRTVLNNPATEVAVVEIGFEEIIEHGLGFDYCDVLVLGGRYEGPRVGLRSPEEVLIETAGSAGNVVIPANHAELADLVAGRVATIVLTDQVSRAAVQALLQDE